MNKVKETKIDISSLRQAYLPHNDFWAYAPMIGIYLTISIGSLLLTPIIANIPELITPHVIFTRFFLAFGFLIGVLIVRRNRHCKKCCNNEKLENEIIEAFEKTSNDKFLRQVRGRHVFKKLLKGKSNNYKITDFITGPYSEYEISESYTLQIAYNPEKQLVQYFLYEVNFARERSIINDFNS